MSTVDSKLAMGLQTPCYVYDLDLLDETLRRIKTELDKHANYHQHYAIKANTDPTVLRHIAAVGFGADCVSGGEIRAALAAGFAPSEISFAGVGKADWEIRLAIESDIECFNVESIAELEVINSIAQQMNATARVCFRINPDVGAHTHANITTGLAENKFGIAREDMQKVIRLAGEMSNVKCIGLHFHIGSQILDMTDFRELCQRVNELQDELDAAGIPTMPIINVGGGLGVDYEDPDGHPYADFTAFYDTIAQTLKLREGQQLITELGRAVVAQMGSLVTKVLYVKQGSVKQFVIVDAGMTDLIRPALYGARHRIENLGAEDTAEFGDISARGTATYDVVGPICESSDVFATGISLPVAKRGDYIRICSAGAYGQTMASQYNTRPLPNVVCRQSN